MDKILNIYKPKDITSHDVVDRVRKKYPGEKVGHCGTLDPLAEGVLIVGVGKATKRLAKISRLDKTYIGEISLHLSSPTDDLETDKKLKVDKDIPPINQLLVKEALKGFEGKIEQRVPLYSATHYQGVKLYKRARKGEQIPFEKLPKKEVEIYNIKLLDFNSTGFEHIDKLYPLVKTSVTCGSGTYIRSIARDLGKKLGTFGLLTSLVRTRIGEYKVEDSIKLKEPS